MKKLFETKYGYFREDGREYVITRPDTPKPWTNVICPNDYGTILTQAGAGYSWQTHATLNRLTRWEQDLIRDDWGKWIYCRDRDTGRIWSLAWSPVRARPTRYECRHGIGYTTITSVNQGIESTLTVFVPPGEPLEIWKVTLRDLTGRARRLDLFTYFEWNLGPSPDTHREFHKLFIETEYAPAANALLATKRLNTIAEHGRGKPWNVEWPHVAFHGSSVRPSAHESDKSRFIGQWGTTARPAALERPRLSNSSGKWQDAIASLQTPVTLGAGKSRTQFFTLGVCETRGAALRLARKYRNTRAVDRAWEATRRHWDSLLGGLSVETADPAFDVLTNTWLKYQAISCRMRGRTGYWQPGGAYGFRDQLQDSQIHLPLGPEHTRRQILLHAAHQFSDGTTWHWWHPLTEEGLKKPYNDDLLWLPFVTLNYLRETADFGLLNVRVPFLREGGAPAGKAGGAARKASSATPKSGTLYEHCRLAIDSFWSRLSKRGVPLMGAGDWNDGLSAIGEKLNSESVWLAHFLVGILDDWAELEKHRPRGSGDVALRYRRAAIAMRRAVNRSFWDGDWYVRATKDNGDVIGSRRNRDGRIFLNAQTWAILSEVVTPRRLPRMLRSMERYLYRKYGPILLSPAYHQPDASIGYLTRYAPGARENGGLYTHAGLWAIQAECKLGRADAAWKLYRSFCPPLRGMKPDFYEVEPYVTPGNVDGPDSPHYGRGGWSWYTGSAAWMFRVSTEWILGVRPVWDGLLIAPCLPPKWKGFHMTRRYRGSTYRITVSTGAQRREVTVDGAAQESNVVPAFEDGRVHTVQVRLPKAPRRGARA